jgi:hypothetical protein
MNETFRYNSFAINNPHKIYHEELWRDGKFVEMTGRKFRKVGEKQKPEEVSPNPGSNQVVIYDPHDLCFFYLELVEEMET